ncbi:MAG: Putative ribosome biogenesis GTPase RsgA, partial [Thermotogales bacterium 46_20]
LTGLRCFGSRGRAEIGRLKCHGCSVVFSLEVDDLEGMVVNVQKGLYTVESNSCSDLVNCTLRKKLLNQSRTAKNLVVVGDVVEFEPVLGGKGVITSIKQRKTRLVRRGAGKRGMHLEQILAANIDIAILVFAVKDPPYNISLVERYICSAESGGIEPVVCFNKIDLVNPASIEQDVSLLRKNGIRVLLTSTLAGNGLEDLRAIVQDRVVVFAGSSGVGKSSLVNSLLSSSVTKTGEVSASHHKGKNTTTSSQMYTLPFGGKVIDIPGMREFGLFSDDHAVEKAFPDIERIAEGCRFRDCSHRHEPDCAVKEAVASGEIDERRFRNYQKLTARG